MKLIIMLCLGTLALSAPAPQRRNQIDFLYDDDETQASVRPVEVNTVEPKVTATKISDLREPAPVFEEEEEEEVDNQEKENSPMASPLNLEQNESENQDPSVDEIDGSENLNNTESSVTSRTDSAVTDTTIRVYDEDEVNEQSEDEERPEKEQTQDQENTQEQDQAEEQDLEHEWNQEQDNKQENEQDQARNNKINQKAEINDSYQYDDESFEKEKESFEKPVTAVPQPTALQPGLNDVLNVELNHGTKVEEKEIIGIQSYKTPLMIPDDSKNHKNVNWDAAHQNPVANNGVNVELKSGQLFNHGTLILERGTFEGQDINHPFMGPFPTKQWQMGERPEFDNWHHGPHGPHGHRGHHYFPGPHNEHHRFDGPPPPWVQRPYFHAHNFDHKSDDHKGYHFHDNGFHREMPTWNNHWENPNPVPPTRGSSTETTRLAK